MLMDKEKDKIDRVLSIYHRLLNGEIVYKKEEANRYGVSTRSIQRDIDDIRDYMVKEAQNTGVVNCIVYKKVINGYKLEQICSIQPVKEES
jgi:predicted DNA-binding transcriptional regulator YafY